MNVFEMSKQERLRRLGLVVSRPEMPNLGPSEDLVVLQSRVEMLEATIRVQREDLAFLSQMVRTLI
jgi:hypothetical protein